MSILSRLFFSEAEKLIKISKAQSIESHHKVDIPDHLGAYKNNWNESVIDWSNAKNIYKSLIRSSGPLFYKIILLQLFASLFSFSTPILINKFITQLQALNNAEIIWSQSNILLMMMLGLGLGMCGAGHGVIIQHYFYQTLNFYQVSTNIINKKIYAHSLKISNITKQKNQIGEVVNLMSSDADAIGDTAITTIDLCNAALLLIGCSAMLFYYIGWSAFVAITVMAVLVPLTQNLAKKFMHLEQVLMKHRDHRMTIMAQILNAIRVVKYFSWEKSVIDEVSAIRSSELDARIKLYKSEILWGLIYTSISTVVLFTALLTHYLRGFEINLILVLTCISVFSIMEDQFGGLSRFIGRFINIFVSGQRISDFLKSETLKNIESDCVSSDEAIQFHKADFSFSAESIIFSNLNFKIGKGESIAVIGAVGTGKSTLLQIILNEINLNSGRISLPSNWKVAYLPQDPFILNESLKENITFGNSTYSEYDLNQAVQLASLKSDIHLFPNGLMTEIGEKGVNLSGGQKQRVCIARCILAKPDLILMDDPLSAVDVRTEADLCEQLIFGAWSDKTRLIVTHRISYLDRFDRILFLSNNNGNPKYSFGTYSELLKTNDDFSNFIKIESENKKSETDIILSKQVQVSAVSTNDNSRVTVDEDKAIGSVENAVYKSYIISLGGKSKKATWIIGAIFFTALLSVLTPLAQKTWLTKFNQVIEVKTLIYGYGILGLITLAVSYFNNLFWMWRGVASGQQFHDSALKALLGTEIRFFDSTPIGRILQRFSRDVESVDVHIQWSFEQTINAILQVSLSFVLIIITLPITIIFLIPVLFYYYKIQNDYRTVAREIKRYDALARSPKYAHFKETLQGTNVIRAFQQQKYFDQQFLMKLQKSNQAYYSHVMLNRWFSTRLPLIGAVISAVTVLAIVYASYKNWMATGLAGLITIYALQFWRYLNWGIRIFSDLESRMTSVERLDFYSKLSPEKEFHSSKDNTIPQSGKLSFRNVRLKYAEHLPYVLNDVSFEIESGAKVGIIGRTGSGKSTLFQAVYRFVEYDQGDIFVDNKSIRDYTLPNLRKSMAVIPQDPSLFMGTLRSNLDRYAEKTDQEIYTILEKVGLLSFVQNLPERINHNVAENGSNLSQGQRQLICLARAMLVQVKIIFLDEATASVDVETDALIQKVIQESLQGITLVTIAHRLSTLKGYDKIIELDNGRVV